MTSIGLPVPLAARQRRSLGGQAAVNGAAWIALAVGGVATTAVLFRALGPAAFGVWAIVAAVRSFTLFLDGGLVFGAAGAAARYRSDPVGAPEELRGSVALGLVCGIVVALLAAAFAWLPSALLHLDGDAAIVAAVATALLGLEVGLALAASPLHGMARGFERFDVIAAGAIAQAAVTVALAWVLTPPAGLVGAAGALLMGRIAGLLPVLSTIRSLGAGTRGSAPSSRAVRRTLAFAAPLWLISAGTQISLGTDVPIVGAFFGSLAAGAYAVGALVPATALSALYALIDTAYPRIAAREPATPDLLRRLLLVGTSLGGLGFTVLAVLAPSILEVWIGSADNLAVDVLRIYSVTWALNVPAHVLVLHAMAVSTHRSLVPVVLAEALVSLALSVALAAAGWKTGPAIATLATLAVSNVVIVPALTLRSAGLRPREALTTVLAGYGSGVIAGLVACALAVVPRLPAVPMLIIGAGLAVLAALTIILMAVVWPGAPRRILSILRNGGIQVWIRQRRELQQARQRLADLRIEHPVVWIPSHPPLVSVRIATYNRGAMVRDRAIASALAQTHPNVEVVVVGDHCDGETEAAVRSVMDRRVRFENLAERGSYPADPQFRWMVAGTAPMNRALDLAKGDWIAPLDDDDEFTPDHIEVLLDACRTGDLEFAYGVAETEIEPGIWEAVGSAPVRHGQIIHAAVLFRREIGFIRHDLDAWRIYEPGDWNVWHRMRDAGVRMGFVDHVVTRHHIERRELR